MTTGGFPGICYPESISTVCDVTWRVTGAPFTLGSFQSWPDAWLSSVGGCVAGPCSCARAPGWWALCGGSACASGWFTISAGPACTSGWSLILGGRACGGATGAGGWTGGSAGCAACACNWAICLSKSCCCSSHCFFSPACCACRVALFILFLCLRLSFAWRHSSESELLIVGHSGTTPRSLLYFLLYFRNRSPVSCK